MPELHSLTPVLSVLLDRGFRVGLVTDGRMSGASGKVPAVIHVEPEAAVGGAIAKIRDGDVIRLDAASGCLDITSEEFRSRDVAEPSPDAVPEGFGRELFGLFRQQVGQAGTGACALV